MIIYDLNNVQESGKRYGGHAGSKKGIIWDNENWFIKFPQTTKDFRNVEISYTTSPISEYLGSHIYELLEIDVHKTLLGIYNNKLVVMCKDFRINEKEVFDDYNSIKNDYVEGLEEKLQNISSSSHGNLVDLDELIIIMDNNPLFKQIPELKERFWDMFIIDSFIGNNDRNNGNWGVIVDGEMRKTRIAPVFDNGSSFNNKSSDGQIEKILKDEKKFVQSVYESRLCIFSRNDKQINPLKFIESMEFEDCTNALKRIVPKIDMNKIKQLIDEIPEEYKEIKVMSKEQKEYYYKTLKYRYENILKKTWEDNCTMIYIKSQERV